MKEEINALDEIHKGACMGLDAINFILEKVDNEDLRNELESELNEYNKITKRIEKIYSKYNEGDPHSTSPINKTMTWSGIEMRTMNDKSTSKITELLLTGVNMGIIEGRRILNNNKLNEEIEDIVTRYVTMQEQNYDNLKKYL